jgi:hypothetical protein
MAILVKKNWVWFVLSFLAGGVLVGIAFLDGTVSLNRLDEVGQEIGKYWSTQFS